MPPTSMPAPDQPPARGTPPSTPAGPLALSPRDHPPAWWLVADGRIVAGDTGAQGGLVESRLVEAGKSGSTRSAAGPWPTTSSLCANDKAFNRVTDFE